MNDNLAANEESSRTASEAASKNEKSLKTILTIRYCIALGLIALVIITTYVFLITQIKHNERDAYIINVSGKQRMLSQRIALFSREVYHANSNSEAMLYANKMDTALAVLIHDHKILLESAYEIRGDKKLKQKLFEVYEGEGGIEQRINVYINFATRFLNEYQNGGLEAVRQSDAMHQIVAIARNGLLDKLNEAVDLYQTNSEEKIIGFERYETFFFAVALLILLCEVLFIFRPMVAQIVSKTDELETSNKELIEFSYRISHDLRAPIVSSVGLVGAAEKAIKANKADIAAKALEHISKSLNRLEELIQDVLNLTRTKLEHVEKERVDLNAMISKSLTKLSHLDGYNKITIHQKIEIIEPINVERVYLTQCIENLISNAIKYADLNKPKSFIEISAINKNDKCIISICDNGIGVPEESRANLFAMFARFHPKVSFGSGLGLYLVQQNIHAIGGDVSYVAHEEGSEFIINFSTS